jgi:predicted RecA/RadA family phage recombinase
MRVQEGNTMRYTTVAALAKNAVVPLTTRVGIAADAIAAAGTGDLWMTGVHNGIPCVAAEVYAQGDALYWAAVPGNITNVQAGNTPAGWAFRAKAAGVATVELKLNG